MNWQSIKVYARDTRATIWKTERSAEWKTGRFVPRRGYADGPKLERERKNKCYFERAIKRGQEQRSVGKVHGWGRQGSYVGGEVCEDTVYWPKVNKQKPTDPKSQTISGQKQQRRQQQQNKGKKTGE